MALLPWIAGSFLVAVLVAASAFLSLRGLKAWRTFKSFSRKAAAAADQVTQTAAAAEARALSLGDGSERLTAAIDRLQATLAEFAIIRAAAAEARVPFTRVRGAVPRK